MSCPRCGLAMRDGVRHGVIVARTNRGYNRGIKPARRAGLIFVCSDGCWYEVDKVVCAAGCGTYLTFHQQGQRQRYCSHPCSNRVRRPA